MLPTNGISERYGLHQHYSSLNQATTRLLTAPNERHCDFIMHVGLEDPIEEFRRPVTRSLLSPCPTENRDELQSSPLPRGYYSRESNRNELNYFQTGQMHLDVTPLKPHIKYSKCNAPASEEMLDFTEFEYQEQEQQRYQTPCRSTKPDDRMSEMPTAQTLRNNPPEPSRQIQIKIEEEPYVSTPAKPTSIKGLRALAEDVSRIVESTRHSTYKEVAELQIQKMESEGKISRNSKDSQNVKRRVYDALNVLISAGVLMRDGKSVCMDPSTSKASSRSVRNDERQKLREQIQQAERSLLEKELKLDSLNKRYKAHKYLVYRNKLAKERNTYEEEHEQEFGERVAEEASRKIPLPCVVLPISIGSYKCRLLRKTLRISSKDTNGISILGDLDVLVSLGFHNNLKQ